MPWPFLHHPAFQSLLLPALASLLCMAVLRIALGAAHRAAAAMGAAVGWALAAAVWPGLVWPATAQAQKLPWIGLLALLAVLVTQALVRSMAPSPARTWWLPAIAWAAGALWWLGVASVGPWLLATALGAAVLAALAWSTRAPHSEPTAAAGSAAALAVALLGLTALAALGGSLLLAQLALMVAACTGVLGLWAWAAPRSGPRVTAAALMPLATLALALAYLLNGNTTAPVHPGAMALLALAATTPWWGAQARWTAQHWRWRPLVVALLAALPVAAALGWQWVQPGGADAAGAAPDDPYYTPRW